MVCHGIKRRLLWRKRAGKCPRACRLMEGMCWYRWGQGRLCSGNWFNCCAKRIYSRTIYLDEPCKRSLSRDIRVTFFCLAKRKLPKKRLSPPAWFLFYSVSWTAIGNSLRSNSRLPKTPMKLSRTGAVAGDLRSKVLSFLGWLFIAKHSRSSFPRRRESSLGRVHEWLLTGKLLVFTLPRFPPAREWRVSMKCS